VTIQPGMIRILIVLSVLILVPGAWISVEQFREARTDHEWSTASGCGIPGSLIDWCSPGKRASNAELAALHRKAAIEYAGTTVALVVGMCAMFHVLRWIIRGFRGPTRSAE
jgi:hypothetical protein